MNFNRIQKYRSQKALTQFSHLKTNHHITNPESSVKVINNNPISKTHMRELANKNQQQTNHTQNSYIQAKGITLRDYLYLASSSSKKASSTEKPRNSSLQSKSQHSRDSKRTHQRSGSLHRKEKYQASNSQIFEIVKKDIKKDLVGLESISAELHETFDEIADYQCLDNSKMIQIYNFRKTMREYVIKQLQRMKEMLLKIKGSEKSEVKMPIIFQKDQQQRYESPIQIDCHIQFDQQQSARRFMARAYSLNQ